MTTELEHVAVPLRHARRKTYYTWNDDHDGCWTHRVYDHLSTAFPQKVRSMYDNLNDRHFIAKNVELSIHNPLIYWCFAP